MTRAEAEKRIRKAAPWAKSVTVQHNGGHHRYAWYVHPSGSLLRMEAWGRTLKAAVSRLEAVLRGGEK